MRCAVVGSPIAHSLSPAMHRAAYAELGLGWDYRAVEVDEAGLAPFLAGLDDSWRGLSVTAPLKRPLVRLVDSVTDDVRLLGVANTVVLEAGRSRGHNTDLPGAEAALLEADIRAPTSARILGGGATAASIALALVRMGVSDLELVVRDAFRAAAAVEVARLAGARVQVRLIDEPMIGQVDVLVSTLPAVAIGSGCHELVAAAGAVLDVVYDPWPTPLSVAAKDADIRLVSGLDLLAHQAALQVQLMAGGVVSPQLLREAALTELVAR